MTFYSKLLISKRYSSLLRREVGIVAGRLQRLLIGDYANIYDGYQG